MSEFNLKFDDLKEGVAYNYKNTQIVIKGGYPKYKASGIDFMARVGDRFKEVKEETKFKEMYLVENAYGRITFTDNIKSDDSKLDYKIMNDQLYVREL